MISTLEGVMGSGNTLAAVTLCYLEFQEGKEVISNVDVNFPYTKLDTEFFLANMNTHEMEHCTLLLDEAYIYLDSRNSATKLNKLFTYFIAQTRKRGVDMFVCIHHIDTVDKRLRRAIDLRGTCRFRKEAPCKKCKGETTVKGIMCPGCNGYGESGYVTVSFFDMRSAKRQKIRIHGPTFWGLYDTNQRIKLTGKQMDIDPRDL